MHLHLKYDLEAKPHDGWTIDDVDPGVREAVAELRKMNYATIDSGDGRTKPPLERTMPGAHIHIVAPPWANGAFDYARRIQLWAERSESWPYTVAVDVSMTLGEDRSLVTLREVPTQEQLDEHWERDL
ncbi:MAG: hypothetical protein MJE66_15315 [Proteobacteria bacterium]|nr:hypothetical protein [Pseudomonadota bacterium]